MLATSSINQRIRVAAVTILYFPDDEVLSNVQSYSTQVDELYIIDNSPYFNNLFNQFANQHPHITYIPNYKNLGIGVALNYAAYLALEKGFDYLLTMDQDSKAPNNLVNILLSELNKLKNVGIISPIHSNKFNTHAKYMRNNLVDKVNTIMTSGNLLSLSAFKSTGKFLEEFFIDYVDIEYCFRLKQNNFSIFRVNYLVLEHNEGNLIQKKFFGKVYYPINNQPIRLYYKTRNLLFLIKKYKKKEAKLLKEECNVYLRNLVKIFLFESNKLLKLKMIFLGVIDFIKNKMGGITESN